MGIMFRKDVYLTLSLIDKLIKPILTYASDFWGCFSINTFEKNPIGLAYMRICKTILGVSKYTSNTGVLHELRVKPIHIDSAKNCFNNWILSSCFFFLKATAFFFMIAPV